MLQQQVRDSDQSLVLVALLTRPRRRPSIREMIEASAHAAPRVSLYHFEQASTAKKAAAKKKAKRPAVKKAAAAAMAAAAVTTAATAAATVAAVAVEHDHLDAEDAVAVALVIKVKVEKIHRSQEEAEKKLKGVAARLLLAARTSDGVPAAGNLRTLEHNL